MTLDLCLSRRRHLLETLNKITSLCLALDSQTVGFRCSPPVMSLIQATVKLESCE